ncbi:MAG: hypothetical protein BroJett039_11300 [Chloroflexota bacterium]|nr:MAG: hypothetical protein BroJett039_11300 [Chloroflexota bacterium]
MNLLIATDHAFLAHSSGVYDTYCFDQAFYHDYLQVFDTVQVISRMQPCAELPRGAFRSDGNGVSFLGVSNLRQAHWFLAAQFVAHSALRSAVEHADAVVVRVPSKLGTLAAKWARQARKPYMIEVIGDPNAALSSSGAGLHYKLMGWLESRDLKLIARYANVGSYVSKIYLSDAYPLAPGKPIDYISSIRLDASEITGARTFLEKPDSLKVIHVGSLTRRKRCVDLIRACAAAKQRQVALKLHLVGGGAERADLEQLVKELNITDEVVFHGHIADRQQLRMLLDDSDLFAMTTASEGLPRAIIEAMARGLPVVGARTPGVDELVRETELFPVGAVDVLVTLLSDLAGNPARLSAMSWHSFETVRQYTNDVLSPKRRYLYEQLKASVSADRMWQPN